MADRCAESHTLEGMGILFVPKLGIQAHVPTAYLHSQAG